MTKTEEAWSGQALLHHSLNKPIQFRGPDGKWYDWDGACKHPMTIVQEGTVLRIKPAVELYTIAELPSLFFVRTRADISPRMITGFHPGADGEKLRYNDSWTLIQTMYISGWFWATTHTAKIWRSFNKIEPDQTL